jgi:membrane protein required for colicin V production
VTAFDLAFLIVMGLSVLVGLWRGLVSEFFALVSWLLALALAWHFAPLLAPYLASVAAALWLQKLIAFGLIVLLSLLVLGLLRFLLRELLAVVGLGLMDRLCGAIFGVLRGILIAVVLVALAGMTSLPHEPWWRDSRFAAPLETIVIAVKPRLPAELAARIKYR